MPAARRPPRRQTPLLARVLGAALACLQAAALPAVEKNTAAPDFSLPLLASERTIDLADYRGRVVLLDFWASWCGPCRQSLPEYQKLRDEFPREDFEVIAITVDEDAADALKFLERHALQFPLPHDPEGRVAAAYQLLGMPTSYLIDRHGIVHSRHSGFTLKDVAPLRALIRDLIEEQADAD